MEKILSIVSFQIKIMSAQFTKLKNNEMTIGIRTNKFKMHQLIKKYMLNDLKQETAIQMIIDITTVNQ